MNSPITLVVDRKKDPALDFEIDEPGGELSAPHFECQECSSELELQEMCFDLSTMAKEK